MKQHNQMVRESREKGRALDLRQRRVLESVDMVLQKAEEGDRVYTLGNPSPDVLVTLDPDTQGGSMMTVEQVTEAGGGFTCQYFSDSSQASMEYSYVSRRA